MIPNGSSARSVRARASADTSRSPMISKMGRYTSGTRTTCVSTPITNPTGTSQGRMRRPKSATTPLPFRREARTGIVRYPAHNGTWSRATMVSGSSSESVPAFPDTASTITPPTSAATFAMSRPSQASPRPQRTGWESVTTGALAIVAGAYRRPSRTRRSGVRSWGSGGARGAEHRLDHGDPQVAQLPPLRRRQAVRVTSAEVVIGGLDLEGEAIETDDARVVVVGEGGGCPFTATGARAESVHDRKS